ncbi:MAG: biotin/lipoyl-containing protein, partial [Gammaproteobacteria bacterium]
MPTDVKVPNIGDFKGVEIIEIPVKPGDSINVDDTILVLESDKATMDIPSEVSGVVKTIKVKPGDKVSEGDVILSLEEDKSAAAAKKSSAESAPAKKAPEPEQAAPKRAAAAVSGEPGKGDMQADLVVLGSGPGGYTAAFHAADLGLKVILVERYPSIGGVCLNVGCIPSKALLHAAKVISETKEAHEFGIEFGAPKIDKQKLSGWKDKVVGQLTGGLKGLAKQRKVEIVHGTGEFVSSNQLSVKTDKGSKTIGFKNAIIAAGS